MTDTKPAITPAITPAPQSALNPPVTKHLATYLEAARKYLKPALIGAALLAVGFFAWTLMRPKAPNPAMVSGNGRVEATEIDLATKLGGRVKDILAQEGDFVRAGQVLAHMQVQTLQAQLDEAQAHQAQTVSAVGSAQAQVAQQQSDVLAAQAVVAQRESDLDAAHRRLVRSQTLTQEGASSEQELDDDRARVRSAEAALAAARAQVAAAQAGVSAAGTQVVGARATVTAAEATVARIQADITDSALTAPIDARVQYRVAQPGEVLGAGGKVLNLVDLSDVYMNFFVPEQLAGRLALGGEVRIVLDAAPTFVIPAKISYVASTAQFTPKTVETASERQKLMFRVKAQIPRELLQKHLQQVKTGLPGVAWLKVDDKAVWPEALALKAAP
jgi:HlyD family secretion protein